MRRLRSLPWESLESFQQAQYLGPRDKFTRLATPLHSLVGGLLSLPLLVLVPISPTSAVLNLEGGSSRCDFGTTFCESSCAGAGAARASEARPPGPWWAERYTACG